jgi:hypothetical protein
MFNYVQVTFYFERHQFKEFLFDDTVYFVRIQLRARNVNLRATHSLGISISISWKHFSQLNYFPVESEFRLEMCFNEK